MSHTKHKYQVQVKSSKRIYEQRTKSEEERRVCAQSLCDNAVGSAASATFPIDWLLSLESVGVGVASSGIH